MKGAFSNERKADVYCSAFAGASHGADDLFRVLLDSVPGGKTSAADKSGCGICRQAEILENHVDRFRRPVRRNSADRTDPDRNDVHGDPVFVTVQPAA